MEHGSGEVDPMAQAVQAAEAPEVSVALAVAASAEAEQVDDGNHAAA